MVNTIHDKMENLLGPRGREGDVRGATTERATRDILAAVKELEKFKLFDFEDGKPRELKWLVEKEFFDDKVLRCIHKAYVLCMNPSKSFTTSLQPVLGRALSYAEAQLQLFNFGSTAFSPEGEEDEGQELVWCAGCREDITENLSAAHECAGCKQHRCQSCIQAEPGCPVCAAVDSARGTALDDDYLLREVDNDTGDL